MSLFIHQVNVSTFIKPFFSIVSWSCETLSCSFNILLSNQMAKFRRQIRPRDSAISKVPLRICFQVIALHIADRDDSTQLHQAETSNGDKDTLRAEFVSRLPIWKVTILLLSQSLRVSQICTILNSQPNVALGPCDSWAYVSIKSLHIRLGVQKLIMSWSQSKHAPIWWDFMTQIFNQ